MHVLRIAVVFCCGVLVSACATTPPPPPPIQNVRTPNSILVVLDRNKDKIYAVYHQHLDSKPSLAGRVVLRLMIAPDGRVVRNDMVRSSIDDTEFTSAVQKTVSEINFGVVRDHINMSIDFPLDFNPRERAPPAPPPQRSYRGY